MSGPRRADTGGPKPYIRPVPMTWFMANKNYRVFMLRELSSFFVAVVVLFQVNLVRALGQGETETMAALNLYEHPLVLAFHLIAAAFVGLHIVTWFKLNAHIMEIRTGEKALPQAYMIAAEYIGLVGVSGALLWFLVGSGEP